MTADPVLVLDNDDVTPTVVVQNDLLRYLFTDDDEEPCPTCGGEGILGINLEPPDQGIHWCPDCGQ